VGPTGFGFTYVTFPRGFGLAVGSASAVTVGIGWTTSVAVGGGAAVNVGGGVAVIAAVCVAVAVVGAVVSECVAVLVAVAVAVVVVVVAFGAGGVFVVSDELWSPRKTAPPMMITAGIKSVHTGKPRFGAGPAVTTCCCC
jgi:hypothetical protein